MIFISNKIIASFLFISMLILLNTSPLSANEIEPSIKDAEAREEFRQRMQQQSRLPEEQQQRLNEALDRRCQMATARINNRINRYEESRERHAARYNGLHQRVSNLPERLESLGCNIDSHRANLDNDLERLNQLIADFVASQRQFTDTMRQSRSLACQEDSREFSTQVRIAQQHGQTVRDRTRVIHTFVTGTLRDNVQRLGQACRQQFSE